MTLSCKYFYRFICFFHKKFKHQRFDRPHSVRIENYHVTLHEN